MTDARSEALEVNPPAETVDDRRRRQTRERVQRHRAAKADATTTTVGGRPGKLPPTPAPTKANPLAFGPGEGLGDPLGVPETKRHLMHAHSALAKIVRSRVDVRQLDDEFQTAAEAYSDIANHLVPWLRILPRVIAPLVLIGALLAIWGAMIVQTPWLQAWWERRQAEREAQRAAARHEAAAAGVEPPPQPSPSPWPPVAVVTGSPAGDEQPASHPPVPVLTRGALSKR